MAFATTADVEVRLKRSLTTEETASYQFLLDGITSLIALAAGKDDAWAEALDPVPNALKLLTVEKAISAGINPENVTRASETIGSYSHSESFAEATGISLTMDEERFVRRVLAGGVGRGTATMGSILDELPEWETVAPVIGGPFGPDDDGPGC